MPPEPCTLRCEVCQRRCNDGPVANCTHRMDCCGEVFAHVPEVVKIRVRGRVQRTIRWVRCPMAIGYLTGPPLLRPRR